MTDRASRGIRTALLVPLLGAAVSGCGETGADSGPALLVASGFTDEVLRIDPVDGSDRGVLDVDVRLGERDEPHAVAVAPDGRHWYLTLSHGDATLWKYETAGDRRVGRVELGLRGAGRIGISPDSRHAVVPDYWLGGGGEVGEVALVELETLEVLRRVETCAAPHDAAWSPDGRIVAVACPLSDEVVALDGESLEVRWRTPIPTVDGEYGTPGAPVVRPMNLLWSADGARIVVTLMRTGEIAVLDADGSGRARARVGGGPTQISRTPGGETYVVPLRDDWAVALVDAETLAVRTRVATPEQPHPHGVTVSPDGATAFVSHEGTIQSAGGVSAIDIESGRLLWSRAAGSFNLGIAWRPAPEPESSTDRE